MRDKPSQALRRGRGSSMWLALEAVHKREADFVVSAGNTGALMAMAKLVLTHHAGHRAAGHRRAMADPDGAPASCSISAPTSAPPPRQLAEFALMGAAMARAVLHIERPRVGLLNIGVEEIKGIEEVRQAHAWLKENELPIDYCGFIEGDQIGQGVADVVVVEGFAGNIALKTAEGTAKQMAAWMREALIELARRPAGGVPGAEAACAPSRTAWTRGASTAGRSWASTALPSRATAARTLSASPAPSRSATRWPRATCSSGWLRIWRRCTASWASLEQARGSS